MSTLNKEIKIIQNPSLGAIIIWRFVKGYMKGNEGQENVPLPLIFIVLPIILHPETCHYVTHTLASSGLRTFAAKFASSRESKADLILLINKRANKMKSLSLKSLNIAIASKYLNISKSDGTIFPMEISKINPVVPTSINPMLKASEKLGLWCSKITLHEISLILKVGF